MAKSSEARSQYLFLALNARGAMDSVRRVVSGEALSGHFSDALQRFFSILLIDKATGVVNHLQEADGSVSFEEVSALEELLPQFAEVDLARAFKSVLGDSDPEEKKAEARIIVSFLGAVESKALQRYNDAIQPQLF
jgi:hypothetical protein